MQCVGINVYQRQTGMMSGYNTQNKTAKEDKEDQPNIWPTHVGMSKL